METTLKLTDIADDLLILNKYTIDTLFKLDNCAECIALYVFYYKTAKWQKTDTVKANDEYVKKSLKWGIDKIRKTKATLKENGLIDIVQRRKNGKIDGWYIRVSYLVSQRKMDEVKILVEGNNTQNQQVESKNTQNQQVENATSSNGETNALRDNNNCFNNDIKMLENNNKTLKENNKNTITPSQLEKEFNTLWEAYPRKQGKAKAYTSYEKARKKGVEFQTVLDGVYSYLTYIRVNKTEDRFIKQGSTWFNQQCWNDDYSIKRELTTADIADQVDFSAFRGDPN